MTQTFTPRSESEAGAGAIAERTAATFETLAIGLHTAPFVTPALRAAGALAVSLAAAALLAACSATTRVTLTPPAQAAVCLPETADTVAVQWRTRWRADQKDVPEREAAAAQGMARFFADGACFRSVAVTRTVAGSGDAPAVPAGAERLLVLTVRELGPTVKLLSSAALVDGGTEVVLDVALYRAGRREPERQFSIHWENGGPGVVKGVQTLPADLAAALKAGLQGR